MAEPTIDVLALRILRAERDDIRAALGDVRTAFREPNAGSARADDADWLARRPEPDRPGLEGVLAVAVEHVVELLRVADEYLVAIETILRSRELLPIPLMSMYRSVMEAALEVCWFVDNEVTSDVRMVRGAAATVRSTQESVKTLLTVPNQPAEELTAKRAAMVGMQQYLQDHGYVLTFGKGALPPYATSVAWGSTKTSMKVSITAAGIKYLPGSHYMWAIGSGATHSRNWFTSGLEGPWETLVIAATAPVLDVSDALSHHLLGYVGLDPAARHRKTHRRRRFLLSRADNAGAYAVDHVEYVKRLLHPADDLG
jgi:hypothetical protein